MHETETLNCNQIIRQARDQPMMAPCEVGETGVPFPGSSNG